MQRLFKIILTTLLVLFLNMPVYSEDLVLFATPEQGIVNGAKVNLRKEPGLKEEVVCILVIVIR